jgi:alpha-D-ribose 1-methylphosphonate 5-triphosphate synthase subunit PhnH
MSVTPPYTPAEARSRETFLALMWALSYPGRIHQLPDSGANFALIAETLLDLETSYYTSDSTLESILAQSGARALSIDTAAYHFYPLMGESELETVRAASVGTMLYPDEAATLIIGCTLNQGTQIKLSGPGVNGQQQLSIAGLPEGFWRLREAACRFPLGWDIYFVDDQQVVGLPRSVQVALI